MRIKEIRISPDDVSRRQEIAGNPRHPRKGFIDRRALENSREHLGIIGVLRRRLSRRGN